MIKLEALADSLAHYNRAYDPDSSAYRQRNPGLLPAISLKHVRSDDGRRTFNSYLDGYQALLFDLRVKCSGSSATKLKSDASLQDLLTVLGHNKLASKYILKFLTKAIDSSVTLDTPVTYFLGA